ncbi:MAG: CHASE2 domain-containing protein, partial [Pseudomonadota bacterium]
MKPVARHNPSPLMRGLIALMIGLSAALFGLTSSGRSVEENLGLDLLFWVRGEQKPPAEVVIVSIDRSSAVALDASDEPEHWPRSLHAALIQRLQDAGARLIIFNVFFGTAQPFEDEIMAEVMREAGNVVLTDYLKRRHYRGGIYVESLAEPVSTLAEAALATAPFLLPQTAKARGFLTRYGDRNTLPVTLLHLYVLHHAFDELVGFFRSVDSSYAEFFENRRAELLKSRGVGLFQSEWARRINERPELIPAVADRLRSTDIPRSVRGALRLLLKTSEVDRQLYFNHYGPAGTIP